MAKNAPHEQLAGVQIADKLPIIRKRLLSKEGNYNAIKLS